MSTHTRAHNLPRAHTACKCLLTRMSPHARIRVTHAHTHAITCVRMHTHTHARARSQAQFEALEKQCKRESAYTLKDIKRAYY